MARIDAERWLAEQERTISRGEWHPPERTVTKAPATLGQYAATVVARRRLRPATVALYDKLLRLAILPKFGERPLAEVTSTEVSVRVNEPDADPAGQRVRVVEVGSRRRSKRA